MNEYPLGCKYPKDVDFADYFGPNGPKIYLFSTSKIGPNVAISGRVEKRPKKDGKSTFALTFFSCISFDKFSHCEYLTLTDKVINSYNFSI